MINLIGTYECKADAKGRLMLPVALKNQLAPVLEQGFVIKRSIFQPCLELYTMEEWNSIMAKINKLNRFVKKNNDFIRMFTAGVKTIEIDSAGRLLIPKDLVNFAGIDKDLVIAGLNVIEIWDKTRYEKAIDDPNGELAKLAEEVMGGSNDDGGLS